MHQELSLEVFCTVIHIMMSNSPRLASYLEHTKEFWLRLTSCFQVHFFCESHPADKKLHLCCCCIMYQKLASCQRDATTNTNLKHPNISSYCSPKGLPGSNISKILNILNIFNIEIIFYMPNTLNISNISLLDVCPKPPLDPSKAMVLVELQWSSCLLAWQHLEVPHNHHHCNLKHHNYCEEKSLF